jgi:hypothetical protein
MRWRRDFAMVGRTDKGLFITTGKFAAEAKKEATRDGAPWPWQPEQQVPDFNGGRGRTRTCDLLRVKQAL